MADNGSLCVCFGRRTLGGGGVGVGGRVGGGGHTFCLPVWESVVSGGWRGPAGGREAAVIPVCRYTMP